MAKRVAALDSGGAGGGGIGGGIRLTSPATAAGEKLGARGFAQYSGGVVPVIGVDLTTTEFASRLRSESLWSISAEVSSPAGDAVLCDTDPLVAGGYTVTIIAGGSVANLQRFERVSAEGTGVVMELIMIRAGGTQGVSTCVSFPMIADDGDIFRLVANGAVVGFVDAAIVALRHW